MLSKLVSFINELDVQVLMGIELEFYSNQVPFLDGIDIKAETGVNQFEAIFKLTDDIKTLAAQVINFKNSFRGCANFDALPFKDQPPSAMQVNFSLWRSSSNLLDNIVIRNSVISSILKFLPESLVFFTRNISCLERLGNLESVMKFRNSPVNISCGGDNNRTTAIRVINEISNKYTFNGKIINGFRIEHRVPSSNCHIIPSLCVILVAIIYGLRNLQNNIEIDVLYTNAFEHETIKRFNLEAFDCSSNFKKINKDGYLLNLLRTYSRSF